MSNDTQVPQEFARVLKDFVRDLNNTFPEYTPLISKWWKFESEYTYIENEEERKEALEQGITTSTKIAFDFCKKRLTHRFIDILYQNEEIFKPDSTIDTEFLPHIHFKTLWSFDISDKTRETMWKYLQLIVFSIIGTLENKEAFGDTTKLFDLINQDEFKTKLEDTLIKMQEIFDSSNNATADTDTDTDGENKSANNNTFNMEDIPNAQDIHEHITGMLDGKLGNLAKEIAEETAQNINLDMENAGDMKDVVNILIKNPSKLMGLVQSVGSKLDNKMKSGEIKESELISEATQIMNKMKNMQGMSEVQSMLSKMGMPDMGGLGAMGGLGGNAKLNTGAMEAQLERKMKLAKQKERMKSKLEANKKAKADEIARQIREMQSITVEQQEQSKKDILDIFSNTNQEGCESSSASENKQNTQNNPNKQNKQNKQNKKKKGAKK